MSGTTEENSQVLLPSDCSHSSTEVGNSFSHDHELLMDSESFNQRPAKPINMSAGAQTLRGWLNKTFKLEMTDGRVLIGWFLCTDRDRNIILGSCNEYLPEQLAEDSCEEPRHLGLVMIPGKHIVSIFLKQDKPAVFIPAVDGKSVVSDAVI